MHNCSHRRPSRVITERGIGKSSISLDARSIVALEWVRHWTGRNTSLDVTPATIVRRALVLLADHLSTLDPIKVAREGQLLREAAKGSGSAVSLTEARARLERHKRLTGTPMHLGRSRWATGWTCSIRPRSGRSRGPCWTSSKPLSPTGPRRSQHDRAGAL